MKRFYLMAAMVGFGISAMAQSSEALKMHEPVKMSDVRNSESTESAAIKHKPVDRTKGDLPVYYTETFSNGMDGENGAWSVDGAQGNLWFHTYPVGAPNGYDENAFNNEHYNNLPSYFNGVIVDSETADNGFMMLDADAYNSTRVVPEDDPSGTDNPLEAFLISPSIDLTGAPNAGLMWTHVVRQCCFNYAIFVDISFDGGLSWQEAWAPEVFEGNVTYQNTFLANITPLMDGEADLSDVKFRFRWPYMEVAANGSTNSHYNWQIDDVSVIGIPDNDLVVGDVAFNKWNYLHNSWVGDFSNDYEYVDGYEYYQTPQYLARPLHFMATVSNTGNVEQTEVGIKATVTLPDGSTHEFITPMEDRTNLASGGNDTLFLNDQMLPGGYPTGSYSVSIEVIQAEEDFNPNDNSKNRTFIISDDGTYSMVAGAGSSLPDADSDYILGQRYIFPQNTQEDMETVITGVEFILYNTTTPGWSTSEGVVMYTNVRKGSLLLDDTTHVEFQPENPYSYSSLGTAYVTDAADFTAGGTVNWISVDFMNDDLTEPIAIPVDESIMYSAEFRVPNLGAGSEVTLALGSGRGGGALLIQDASGDEPSLTYFSGAGSSVRFKTASVTSVKNVSYEHGIQLFQNYPNPFTDQSKVNFKLPSASKVSVEIHDIQGRLISSDDLGTLPQGVSEFYLDSKGMSPGIYTYTLITDLGNVTRKYTIK